MLFRTMVSILTASCFTVLFGSLRFLLHKILGCYLFFSESNIFENFWVNCFQTNLVFNGRAENCFCAAPTSVV